MEEKKMKMKGRKRKMKGHKQKNERLQRKMKGRKEEMKGRKRKAKSILNDKYMNAMCAKREGGGEGGRGGFRNPPLTQKEFEIFLWDCKKGGGGGGLLHEFRN